MVFVVFTIFVGLLIAGAFFILPAMIRSNGGSDAAAYGTALAASFVLIVVWGIIFLMSSVRTVESGQVGIVYRFGQIVGKREEGVTFIWPWEDIKSADIKTQAILPEESCDNGHENCLSAFSKESQDVYIQPTLNISLNPEAVEELFRTVGPNYLDRIVRPRMAQRVKEATVIYESTDIAPNREIIRQKVKQDLTKDLEPYSITVTDFLLTNIDFSPAFKASIEAKQLASQEALKEQENVAKARAIAEQKIEEARGEAGRLRETAQGQADANRLVAQSITPEIIQMRLIDKLADDLKVISLPSGAIPLFDLQRLLSGGQ